MQNNTLSSLTKFDQLDESQLANIDGGIVPLAVWGIWAGAAAAGFSGGISVGLNRVNRKH